MIRQKTLSGEKEKSAKKDTSVSSVTRSANILACLSQGLNTVTEISIQCRLSKSTVHRLLNTMAEPGFVIYDSINHRYFLGPLITRLASSIEATHQPLIICAEDEMQLLSSVTGETITLTLLVGLEFVRLYAVLSKNSLKVEEPEDDSKIKQFLPHGALQRVLLSQLSDKDLKMALRRISKWAARYPGGIDTGHLMTQIVRIKEQGYGCSFGEILPGCICISTPVAGYSCPAALSMLGPETRIRPNLAGVTENLLHSARRISADLAELLS
jgi:DNA-binding IclR family transcriptional regulator